ncbi:MAG: GNAT family N-acetyltransferase [Phycisphaerales bacterium JB052]
MRPHAINIRPVETRDIALFYDHLQHPPAQQMAAFIHEDPADRAAHDAHWAKLLASDSILKRSIELVQTNTVPVLVGHIISFDMDGDREITYWVDHHYWGKGIATEALRQFLHIEQVRPLFGRAALDNAGSIRVMERNGFALLRQERGYAHARGAEIDEVVMVRSD